MFLPSSLAWAIQVRSMLWKACMMLPYVLYSPIHHPGLSAIWLPLEPRWKLFQQGRFEQTRATDQASNPTAGLFCSNHAKWHSIFRPMIFLFLPSTSYLPCSGYICICLGLKIKVSDNDVCPARVSEAVYVNLCWHPQQCPEGGWKS